MAHRHDITDPRDPRNATPDDLSLGEDIDPTQFLNQPLTRLSDIATQVDPTLLEKGLDVQPISLDPPGSFGGGETSSDDIAIADEGFAADQKGAQPNRFNSQEAGKIHQEERVAAFKRRGVPLKRGFGESFVRGTFAVLGRSARGIYSDLDRERELAENEAAVLAGKRLQALESIRKQPSPQGAVDEAGPALRELLSPSAFEQAQGPPDVTGELPSTLRQTGNLTDPANIAVFQRELARRSAAAKTGVDTVVRTIDLDGTPTDVLFNKDTGAPIDILGTSFQTPKANFTEDILLPSGEVRTQLFSPAGDLLEDLGVAGKAPGAPPSGITKDIRQPGGDVLTTLFDPITGEQVKVLGPAGKAPPGRTKAGAELEKIERDVARDTQVTRTKQILDAAELVGLQVKQTKLMNPERLSKLQVDIEVARNRRDLLQQELLDVQEGGTPAEAAEFNRTFSRVAASAGVTKFFDKETGEFNVTALFDKSVNKDRLIEILRRHANSKELVPSQANRRKFSQWVNIVQEGAAFGRKRRALVEQGRAAVTKKLPPAKYKDDTAVDPGTGLRFTSDGTRWRFIVGGQ